MRAAPSEGYIFGGLHQLQVPCEVVAVEASLVALLKRLQRKCCLFLSLTKLVWGSKYKVSLAQFCMSNSLNRTMRIEMLIT